MALWLGTQALTERVKALETAVSKNVLSITSVETNAVTTKKITVKESAKIDGTLAVAKAAVFADTILVKGTATFEGSLEVKQGLVLGRRSIDGPVYVTTPDGTVVEPDKLLGEEVIVGVKNTDEIRTLILQSAIKKNGKVLIIKDESGRAEVHNIIVETELEETIDGQDSLLINTDYGVLRLYSDGTNWFTF